MGSQGQHDSFDMNESKYLIAPSNGFLCLLLTLFQVHLHKVET